MRWRLFKATKDTDEPCLIVAFVVLGEQSQLIAGSCSYWADNDVRVMLAGQILHYKPVRIWCL
jgi:hypothetical protein